MIETRHSRHVGEALAARIQERAVTLTAAPGAAGLEEAAQRAPGLEISLTLLGARSIGRYRRG